MRQCCRRGALLVRAQRRYGRHEQMRTQGLGASELPERCRLAPDVNNMRRTPLVVRSLQMAAIFAGPERCTRHPVQERHRGWRLVPPLCSRVRVLVLAGLERRLEACHGAAGCPEQTPEMKRYNDGGAQRQTTRTTIPAPSAGAAVQSLSP